MRERKTFKATGGGLMNSMANPFDLVDADAEDVLDTDDLSKTLVVLIRKAAKKDMATRLKSLEELKLVLLREEHQAELQSVAFAKHLLKLLSKASLDPERRVREAAFALLHALCEDPHRRKCLNHVFPDLAFYWIGAFMDPVGSVSGAAKRAFDMCFSDPNKVQLAYKAIRPGTRKMIKETMAFRAEEARQAAVSDPSSSESAQLVFSLHLIRAIGCAAFLSKFEGTEEEGLCGEVMKAVDLGGDPKLVNHAIYSYALTVKLPEDCARRILQIALADVDNAFCVLDLLESEHYANVVLDESAVAEYCRLCISSHPAALIPKVAKWVAGRGAQFKPAVIASCLHINTVDSIKLTALIEHLFALTSDDDRLQAMIFDAAIKTRHSPWNNLDISSTLDSLATAFTDDFVATQLAQMDCSTSVPLILASKRGGGGVDQVCSCLQNLTLSPKDIGMILSDPQLAQSKQIIDVVFPRFVDCLNRNQLTGLIKHFNVERVLTECHNKDAILAFLSHSGTDSSPWLPALELSRGAAGIVHRMLSVAEYSDALMDALEPLHCDDLHAPIHPSWLESARFCKYLITTGHPELAPVSMVRRLPREFQLAFVEERSDLFDFVDEQQLIRFNQKICRSSVGWSRHHYLNLVEEDHNDVEPFVDVSVLQTLTARGFIRPHVRPHVAVYMMWIDDRHSTNHHQGTIAGLIQHMDELSMAELSARCGGYYSLLYERCCKSLPLPVSLDDCSDHCIATCRLAIDSIDLEQCRDQSMRLSIMIPVIGKVPKDTLRKTLAEDAADPRLFAAALASIDDNDVVGDNAESIARFISQHGLLGVEFLSKHPDFLTPQLSSSAIDAFLSDDCGRPLCTLVRQIAPFKLDSFAASTIAPLVNDQVKSRSARFIFNLLHDSLIHKLQSVLPSEQDDTLHPCLPPPFFHPESIEAFELLVGLAEASKEVPLVLAALSRAATVSPSLVHHMLMVLGWTEGDGAGHDLRKTEFTVVDWDEDGVDGHCLVANLLFRALRIFPQLMRKSLAAFKVDAQVRHYISPMIIQRELDKCRRYTRMGHPANGDSSGGSLTVKVLHSSTQCTVQAEYHFEDTRLSVALEVPSAYPLAPLHIDAASGRKGVSEARWKASLLSAAPILTAATDIMEGLRTWAANLNKQLAGIDPCSICYCVMHPTDRTLPSPQCRTCAHRFHSHCLYKWFRTGGQATCPMCRSLF